MKPMAMAIISQADMKKALENIELFKVDMPYNGDGVMSVSFDGIVVNSMFPMTHWRQSGEEVKNPATEKLDLSGVSRIFVNLHNGTDYEYVLVNGNWEVEVFYYNLFSNNTENSTPSIWGS